MAPPAASRPASPAAPAARAAARPEPAPVRIHHKPPRSWTLAASAVIALEALLLAILALRSGLAARYEMQRDDLMRALLQADQIRSAWAELGQRGALLKARLAAANVDLKELQRRLVAAGKAQGLAVRVERTQSLKRSEFGVKAVRLRVTADGPEDKLFAFLFDVDRISAIMDLDTLQLAGTAKGVASLRLVLRHFELSGHVRKRLEAFVADLPNEPAGLASGEAFSRGTPLFLPSVPTDEEALRGWPRILLSGFSQDQAYLVVDGQTRAYRQGDLVAPDVTYVEKYSVNQVLLRRGSDHTEVLLTVGSPTYSLKPTELRGMSEFVVTLQRQGQSPMLTGAMLP